MDKGDEDYDQPEEVATAPRVDADASAAGFYGKATPRLLLATSPSHRQVAGSAIRVVSGLLTLGSHGPADHYLKWPPGPGVSRLPLSTVAEGEPESPAWATPACWLGLPSGWQPSLRRASSVQTRAARVSCHWTVGVCTGPGLPCYKCGSAPPLPCY